MYLGILGINVILYCKIIVCSYPKHLHEQVDTVYTSGLRQNYPSRALTPTIGVNLGKTHDLSVSVSLHVKCKKN